MAENRINEHYKKYYEIIEEIGKGGAGTVYKAKQKGTNEMRAIKIIDLDYNEEEILYHVEQGLEIMKKCSKQNENSVKFYEYYYYKEYYINKIAIVMELCDKSLQKLLNDRREGFKSKDIYFIMRQLNNTFKIMSENNILHRDIKLDNILIKKINNKTVVKLTDYDTCKYSVGKTHIGTDLNMAPEVLEGDNNKKYDYKCDLWSIGIIIYQLYFNKYPYKGRSQVAIYKNIKKNPLKLENIDNNLEDLIYSLLKQNPEERITYEEYFNHPFFNKKNKDNYIIAEFEIEEKDENEEIRIINSHESFYREDNKKIKEEFKNEEEIKDICKIRINNTTIPFSYFYTFKKKGVYQIKYIFKENIKKIDFLFSGCECLKSIDLTNFNTQNIIYMNHMFSYCISLININLSNCNTKNVTDMSNMFNGCASLTSINLSNFNTQNVTDMSSMFDGCKALSNINLSNFNTENVTDMTAMFDRCESLTNIDLSNFITKKVINMSSMFWGCESLENINLSKFNTENVTRMRGMFNGCKSLTSINLSSFNTQNVVTMQRMFMECKKLKEINLSNFNTENVKNINEMFYGCESLKSVDFIFDPKKVNDMSHIFDGCKSLENLNIFNEINY